MPTSLTIHVVGKPVQQGSKVANRFGHGVRDANAKTLRPWRAEVSGCVLEAMRAADWQTLDCPIGVELAFAHVRPAAHYGTGRNAGVLKPSAPFWKATAPDVDKLIRAVFDSLTDARAIRDDSRIARLIVEDLWADAESGVHITVYPLTDSAPAADRSSAAGAVTQVERALF